MSNRYLIKIHGCDDATVMDVELTDQEWNVITRLGLATRDVSDYGCQPTLSVAPYAGMVEPVDPDDKPKRVIL